MKDADKQEEEEGVNESSHAENGRGFQPVIDRESCYQSVFWLLAISQTETVPRNAEWERDKGKHEELSDEQSDQLDWMECKKKKKKSGAVDIQEA